MGPAGVVPDRRLPAPVARKLIPEAALTHDRGDVAAPPAVPAPFPADAERYQLRDCGQWTPLDVCPAQRQILTLLYEGRVTIGDVLASKDPDAHITDVRLMLEAARDVGVGAAAALMGQAGIVPGSTTGGLSDTQRRLLLEAVSAIMPRRAGGR